MDGVPMKELNVGGTSKAAIVFLPLQVSKKGESLAHDEPYVLRNGKHREVVIHTAEHVREFLRKDSKGQCVGALHGEEWRVVRRHFDPVYTHGVSLTLINPFKQEVESWLKALKNDSLRAGVGRMVVHAPTSCGLLPLRVIPLSFYGEAFDDEEYSKLVRISAMQKQALKNAVVGRWQKYKWYNMLPTSSSRILEQYQQEWKGFNTAILDKARIVWDIIITLVAFSANTIQSGMDIPANHVFQGVKPEDGMSMDQYLQTIDEMIFTNIDITGNILAFMFGKLAKHPDFQQRLFEEIVSQKDEVGLIDFKNYLARQTTLLHYLCLESVRLHPAISFSVPEHTTVDKVIGRYKIPAHTPFVIDVCRLNTNALTWGADGSEFRPERFSELSPNDYRYGFMRFGIVSGKCLGKHMADVLMKVALIIILEKYKIEEVEMNIGVKPGDLAFITHVDEALEYGVELAVFSSF
ncbi:unnamed protein product [Penicillium manginii]